MYVCTPQAWARAELDRDNVGNARIILAEALRRSPAVQPLYVLGGSLELKASNLGAHFLWGGKKGGGFRRHTRTRVGVNSAVLGGSLEFKASKPG
eukprot:156036-Chlamydomonas_euryale.AAC.3